MNIPVHKFHIHTLLLIIMLYVCWVYIFFSRAIYFCTYAQAKQVLNQKFNPNTPIVHILSALSAGSYVNSLEYCVLSGGVINRTQLLLQGHLQNLWFEWQNIILPIPGLAIFLWNLFIIAFCKIDIIGWESDLHEQVFEICNIFFQAFTDDFSHWWIFSHLQVSVPALPPTQYGLWRQDYN